MRRVDHLVGGDQALVDEAKQVLLSGPVKAGPGLVEEQDQPLRSLELRQRREQGEEPGEALGPVAEVQGDAVAKVADPQLDERPFDSIGARALEVDVELDGELPVLAPVLEHLPGEVARRRLQRSLPRLVPVPREIGELDPGEPDEGEDAAFARREGLAGRARMLHREPPRHHAVLVEVEEGGQALLEDGPDLARGILVRGAGREVAAPVRVVVEGERLQPFLPTRVGPLVVLPRAPRLPERLRPQREHGLGLGAGLQGERRGAGGPELPYEPIPVRPRDRHPPGGERTGAEQPLHGPHVLVLELEGGGDGTPLRDALPFPRELAARVIAQIDERLGVTGGDRIEAIEGLEESGLSALVLADEAGDVGLNPHLPGIQEALVLSHSYRSQNHVGVPVRRPPRAALAGCRFIERRLPRAGGARLTGRASQPAG